MAEKGFGVKEVNLIGASGTPTITSPNNLNLNAVNVAISTNATVGGTLSVTGNVSIGGTLTYEDVTSIDSVGIVTAREGVFIPDNKELKIGNTAGSPDTKIFHNGTKTRLVSSVQYDMDADIIDIHNASANAMKARFLNNQVELFYANNKKFETTSSGATVTGTLTATTFSGSGASLTSLPAANLTGTLPAISGANLTNLPATDPTNSDIQVVYTVTANGSSAYRFAGNGVVSTADNPDLYFIRGQKYRFINNSGGSHPFQIREASGGTAYSTGVTNNGAASGNIDFAPTYDSPAQLVYQCTSHGGMVGNIYLRDAAGNNTNVGVTTFSSVVNISGNTNISSELRANGNIRITNAGPKISLVDSNNDDDFEIKNNDGVFTVRDATDGVDRFAIDSSGNVGVNRTSPAALLHVSKSYTAPTGGIDGNTCLLLSNSGGSAYAGLAIQGTTSGGSYIHFGDTDDINVGNILYDHPTNSMQLITNATERLRIASNGTVSVKTGGINLENATATSSRAYSITNAAGTTGWTFGNGVTASSHQFVIYDNTAGAARLTIDSDGKMGHNKAASGCTLDVEPVNNTHAIRANGQQAGYATLLCDNRASSGTRHYISFRINNGVTGKITSTGSSTVYATSSDYRLKENVTAISDGIKRLKTLKPSRFNWKADSSTTVDGFIAHEVTAVPEAVVGTKDEVDSDNNPVYQAIDEGKLVPLLTAALQEAITKIENLEAEVTALKAK